MPIHLSPIEVRVLGALIEKESTTPEYYSLSLNALVNACNQKNNREPVMQLNEDEVRNALHRLQDRNLAAAVHDSRVTKYEHHLQEVFNLTRGETAILCILLLRRLPASSAAALNACIASKNSATSCPLSKRRPSTIRRWPPRFPASPAPRNPLRPPVLRPAGPVAAARALRGLRGPTPVLHRRRPRHASGSRSGLPARANRRTEIADCGALHRSVLILARISVPRAPVALPFPL